MAWCKNPSRGPGDDDNRCSPPPSTRDKGKAVAEVRPKKCTRLDRGQRQAIAIPTAADHTEKGQGFHIGNVHLSIEGRELGTEEGEQAESKQQQTPHLHRSSSTRT